MSERAMTPEELRLALRLARSTFFKYQAMGRFAAFELKPRIGPHRYSRRAVESYLNREPVTAKGAAAAVAAQR